MSYTIAELASALLAVAVVVGMVPGGAIAAGGGLEGGNESGTAVAVPVNGTAYVVSVVDGQAAVVASENVSVNETVGDERVPAGATVGASANGSEAFETPLVVHIYESDVGARPACDTNANVTEACKVYTQDVPPHFWDATPADRPDENPLPVDVPGVPVELLLQHPENLPNVVIIVIVGEINNRWPDQAPVEPNDLPVRLQIPSDPTIPDDHPIKEDEIGVPDDRSDDDDGQSDGGSDDADGEDGNNGDGSGEADDGTGDGTDDTAGTNSDGPGDGASDGGNTDDGSTGAGDRSDGTSDASTDDPSSDNDDGPGSEDPSSATATEDRSTDDGTTGGGASEQTADVTNNGTSDGGLNTPAGGPGFGVFVAAIGLLSGALVARRWTA